MTKTVHYLMGGLPMTMQMNAKKLAEFQELAKNSPVKTGEFFTTYKILSIE